VHLAGGCWKNDNSGDEGGVRIESLSVLIGTELYSKSTCLRLSFLSVASSCFVYRIFLFR
jgi:hypothetical protein